MKEVLISLLEDDKVTTALISMLNDVYLGEVSMIDPHSGPLVEFPPSINENIYCKIAQFAMDKCPKLTAMLVGLVVRREEPVMPKDVLRIATHFSNLCYGINKNLDSLIKLKRLL